MMDSTHAGSWQRTGLALVMGMTAIVIDGRSSARAETLANCMTTIIADVPAEEASEQVKSKGGSFGPVTRIKVNKKTGRMVYCSGPSYCYWSNALQLVSACRIKRDNDVNDASWFVYFTR